MDANVLCRNGVSRTWVQPNFSTSVFRDFVSDAMTFYASQWRLLPQDSMQLWHNFNFINHNSFNKSVVVSGLEAFISCNIRLAIILNDNLSIHVATPVNAIPYPFQFSIGTWNTTQLNLIPITPSWVDYVEVAATVNLSAGIFKPRSCDFRIIGFIDSSAIGTVDIFSLWNSRFGILPVVGSKIFVRLRTINVYGIASMITSDSKIVS